MQCYFEQRQYFSKHCSSIFHSVLDKCSHWECYKIPKEREISESIGTNTASFTALLRTQRGLFIQSEISRSILNGNKCQFRTRNINQIFISDFVTLEHLAGFLTSQRVEKCCETWALWSGNETVTMALPKVMSLGSTVLARKLMRLWETLLSELIRCHKH